MNDPMAIDQRGQQVAEIVADNSEQHDALVIQLIQDELDDSDTRAREETQREQEDAYHAYELEKSNEAIRTQLHLERVAASANLDDRIDPAMKQAVDDVIALIQYPGNTITRGVVIAPHLSGKSLYINRIKSRFSGLILDDPMPNVLQQTMRALVAEAPVLLIWTSMDSKYTEQYYWDLGFDAIYPSVPPGPQCTWRGRVLESKLQRLHMNVKTVTIKSVNWNYKPWTNDIFNQLRTEFKENPVDPGCLVHDKSTRMLVLGPTKQNTLSYRIVDC